MKLKLIASILALFNLFGCQSNKSNNQNITESKMVKKYLVINDKVIEERDPFKTIEPLWWTVNIYDSKAEYEKDLEPYSAYQRYVFAIMWYLSEVNNGGHHQFYSNSTGIVWEDAMEGFDLIGLQEGKKIIQESAERFGSPPSFVRAEREQKLDSLDLDFEDLDNRFYKLDLINPIADFISKNKMPYYFKGEVMIPE